MKNYFFVCILILLTVSIPLSGQSDLQLNYQRKISHYKQMKRMGGSLIPICKEFPWCTGFSSLNKTGAFFVNRNIFNQE